MTVSLCPCVRCVNHNDTEYKDVQTVRRHLKRWGPFNKPQQVLDSMLQKKQKLDMSDHNDIPQDNVLDVDADDNASDHEDHYRFFQATSFCGFLDVANFGCGKFRDIYSN